MEIETGDMVMLYDKHSEFDRKVGEVIQITETMFDDRRYTVDFVDEQEVGLPECALERLDEEFQW